MKKIALQIFGHLRTYKVCYPYLKKHLLDLGDFDIFIHTWDESQRKTESHSVSYLESKLITDSMRKDVVNTYKPKKIEFSSQQEFEPESYMVVPKGKSYAGLRNMFYSMSRSCVLRNEYEKECGIDYDLVIVIRPDVLLRSPFPLDDIIHKLKQRHYNQCLYSAPIMKERLFLKKPTLFDYRIAGIDVFFLGTPKIIHKISNISDTDDFYHINDLDEKTRYWGESQFSFYLIKNNISQKYLTYIGPKNWRLQRTNNFKVKTEESDFRRNLRLSKQYAKQAIKNIFIPYA